MKVRLMENTPERSKPREARRELGETEFPRLLNKIIGVSNQGRTRKIESRKYEFVTPAGKKLPGRAGAARWPPRAGALASHTVQQTLSLHYRCAFLLSEKCYTL